MPNENKSRVGFWSGIIAVIVVVTLIVVSIANKSDNGSVPVTGELVKIQADDWTRGNPESSVVLIEYSDFQCPYCKVYSVFSAKLAEEFADDIVIAFRHFPLDSIHSNAELAAYATESAGRQGKFWPMHDLIFEKQEEWSELDNPIDTFAAYAESLELNVEQFKTDLADKAIRDKVKNNAFGAEDLGLNSTPSFILNGQKINNPKSYDQFRQLIQEQLQTK